MADTRNVVQVVFEAITKNFQTKINGMKNSMNKFGSNGEKELEQVNTKLVQTGNVAKKVGGILKTLATVYVGKKLIEFGGAAVKEYGKTQTALGEMSSLGYQDLETLRGAAIDFSNTWSGTTRENFISSAYDIKSGIASLSDEGVAEFTKLAALTGKATKSTVDEMTTLFAQGYGIYKNAFANDFDFGRQFSAGISKSVQQFRTTGTEMSSYLSTLGATGQKAGADLSEILAVGGTLQATMSGSEAATKYQSFLNGAMKASKVLGLTFVDNNNQLLSATDIVDKIREKFGDTIDATESADLMKAFGRKEAADFIKQIYDKTIEVKEAQEEVNSAMEKGTKTTEKMAETMNKGFLQKLSILKQKVSNVFDKIGQKISPYVSKAVDKISDALDKLEDDGTIESIARSMGNVVETLGKGVEWFVASADDFGQSFSSILNIIATTLPSVVNLIKEGATAWLSFKMGSGILFTIQAMVTAYKKLKVAITEATIAQELFKAVGKKGWIGIIIAAVIYLTVKIIGLGNIIRWLGDLLGKIPGIGQDIKNTFYGLANSIDEFSGHTNNAADSIKNLREEANKPIEVKFDTNTLSGWEMSQKAKFEKEFDANNDMPNKNNDKEWGEYLKRREKAWEKYKKDNHIGMDINIPDNVSNYSSGITSKPKTIADKVRDIDTEYNDEEDVYNSRIDLAKQNNDYNSVEKNQDLLIDTYKQKLEEVNKLDKKAKTNKAKNIIESARNKILLKIQRITEGINDGINKAIGEFNKPSNLSAYTNYQYKTQTSNSVLNKKVAFSPNMTMQLTVKNLDKEGANKVTNQANKFMDMVASGMGKNDLVSDFMSQVTRS